MDHRASRRAVLVGAPAGLLALQGGTASAASLAVAQLGPFAQASRQPVDRAAEVVRTSGFAGRGPGAAHYVHDPAVNEAFVRTHPRAAFLAPDGRGFRLAELHVNPLMFGAPDARGRAKGPDEIVEDSSAALEAAWAWVRSRPESLTLDFSVGQGWGLTRPLDLVADQPDAWWNGRTYHIVAGRFVAMAPLPYLVRLKNKRFQVSGAWELFGGVDRTVDGKGYGASLARNGLVVENSATSVIGDVFASTLRRYAVQFAKRSDTPNNNIPINGGTVTAIGCGSPGGGSGGMEGRYSRGVYEGGSGSHQQRHLMTLSPARGADPGDLETGDVLLFGEHSEGIITEIVSVSGGAATVRIFPWQPEREGGAFRSCHGGAVSIWGGDTANTRFDTVYALECGTALQLNALYGPKIDTLLAESSGVGVAIGEISRAVIGADISHLHIENVARSVLDLFAVGRSIRFGPASSMSGTEHGIYGKAKRLAPGYVSAGTFGPGEQGLVGISFETTGGTLHGGFGGPVTAEGEGTVRLSNEPGYDEPGPLRRDRVDFILLAEHSIARRFSGRRLVRWGPVYGSGPNGAPTGSVTFAIEASDKGVTVNGGRGPVTLSGAEGALVGVAVFEPAGERGGNWRIGWSTLRM